MFAITIDVLWENLRSEQLWELLFADNLAILADDLAILADSEKRLQERLLKWQESLEKYGLKTKTMVCSKNGNEQVNIKEAHGEELQQVKKALSIWDH